MNERPCRNLLLFTIGMQALPLSIHMMLKHGSKLFTCQRSNIGFLEDNAQTDWEWFRRDDWRHVDPCCVVCMGGTREFSREFSREGHDFQPKTTFCLHDKEKTTILAKFRLLRQNRGRWTHGDEEIVNFSRRRQTMENFAIFGRFRLLGTINASAEGASDKFQDGGHSPPSPLADAHGRVDSK